MQNNFKVISGPILYALAFVAFVHILWIMSIDGGLVDHGFRDGDSYLRLVQVERLIETLGWYDSSVPRSNAPFGTTVHWTRLFDLVLLAITAPLLPFMEFSKALYWAGVVVSPVLHIILAGILIWAVTPVIGRVAALLTGGLSFTQAGIMNYTIAGNADHHVLLMIFSTFMIGITFRIFGNQNQQHQTRWLEYALGFTFAMGLWASPETLLMTFVCLLVTSIFWLFGNVGAGALNRKVCMAFFVSTFAFLLIDKGFNGFFIEQNDRISIIHLTMSGGLLLFWLCVKWGTTWLSTLTSRIMVAAVGVVILMFVMTILFPIVLKNPIHVQGGLFEDLNNMISELKSVTDVTTFFVFLGSLLFVGPTILLKVSSSEKKWEWIFIAIGSLVFVIASFYWLRWSTYAGVMFAIVIAVLVVNTDEVISKNINKFMHIPVKLVVILLIIFGPQIIGLYMRNSADKVAGAQGLNPPVKCSVRKMSEYLGKPPWSDRSRIILSSANIGAELLYRTDHQVIATVQHRTPDGILDGYSMLNSSDAIHYGNLIKVRSVDLILLCPGSNNDAYFLYQSTPNSLYRSLLDGRVPTGMRVVDVPLNFSGKFKLFEVVGPVSIK